MLHEIQLNGYHSLHLLTRIDLNSLWKMDSEVLPHNYSMIFLAFVAAGLNLYVILSILRHSPEAKVCHLSLLSLACSDFFLGATTLPVFIYRGIYKDVSMLWCQYHGFVNVCFAGSSIMSLALLSFERYRCIVKGRRMSRSKVGLIVLGIWLLSITLGSLPFITRTYQVPQAAGIYCLGDFRLTTLPHRVYAVGCIAVVLISISVCALSNFSICRKIKSDSFRWHEVSTYLYNPQENLTSLPHSEDFSHIESSSTHAASSDRISDSNSDTFTSDFPKNIQIVASRMRQSSSQTYSSVNIKLFLIAVLFFVGWSGMSVHFLYATVTGHQFSKHVDYILLVLAQFNSVSNAMVVLIVDGRWKGTLDLKCLG
ncbi:hypothetical protein BKA69DRAFT_650931 [Paraphysoderma sedebokerense]|nr:hypothetical protein BKA69DRAFT_650931 [Paraphysoderma sedebokerense]